MKQEFIIADASVKYEKARNPLEESLLYAGENNWTRKLDQAQKFNEANAAIEIAKKLKEEAPVKVLLLQTEGNRVGIGVVNF